MVELESEGELTRSEVALFLREFANELDDDAQDRDRERGEFVGDADGPDDTVDERREEHREEFIDDVDERDRDRERDDPVEGGRERREEFAEEEFAEEESLDHKRITLIVGGDSATVTVPNTVEFDVEVESRSPMFSSGVNQGIEFELSWDIENPDEIGEDWIEVE